MARNLGTPAALRPTVAQVALLGRLFAEHGNAVFMPGKGQTARQLAALATKGLAVADGEGYRLSVHGGAIGSTVPGGRNTDLLSMGGYGTIDTLNREEQRCEYRIKAARYGAATRELTEQLNRDAWYAKVRRSVISRVRRGH
jgi:hypothetical protein